MRRIFIIQNLFHTATGEFMEDGKDPVSKFPLLIWDYSHPGAQKYITEL